MICLFVFSYLAVVTIAGDRAANLDVCLVHTAFRSEGSFACHTYCEMGHPFLGSYPKKPSFWLLNAVLVVKEQSPPISNVLGLTRPARAGLELTIPRMLSESTTTRLSQGLARKNKHVKYESPTTYQSKVMTKIEGQTPRSKIRGLSSWYQMKGYTWNIKALAANQKFADGRRDK
jgi:hypothetical protein